MAAAARLAGVTPATIRGWQQKGWLPAPPWTKAQIGRATTKGRQVAGRGSEAPHGSASRWRAGCSCQACADAHNTDIRTRRADAASASWATIADGLCGAFAAGTPYREALDTYGVTPSALSGQRRRDPDFAARVDEALTDGRNPDLAHGPASGWRNGCRCPECRADHDRTGHANHPRT